MKETTIAYARLGAAVALSIVGVITLMMIPGDADPAFAAKLVGSKAIAAASLWASYRLTRNIH